MQRNKAVSEMVDERTTRDATSDVLARWAADRPYSWVEDYLGRLEGKEAREPYYAAIEHDAARDKTTLRINLAEPEN